MLIQQLDHVKKIPESEKQNYDQNFPIIIVQIEQNQFFIVLPFIARQDILTFLLIL